MNKQRRVFFAEFKCEAIDFILKKNYSTVEASRSFGIGESALPHWAGLLQASSRRAKRRPQSSKKRRNWELESLISNEINRY